MDCQSQQNLKSLKVYFYVVLKQMHAASSWEGEELHIILW